MRSGPISFPLSLRESSDLLATRGIIVSLWDIRSGWQIWYKYDRLQSVGIGLRRLINGT